MKMKEKSGHLCRRLSINIKNNITDFIGMNELLSKASCEVFSLKKYAPNEEIEAALRDADSWAEDDLCAVISILLKVNPSDYYVESIRASEMASSSSDEMLRATACLLVYRIKKYCNHSSKDFNYSRLTKVLETFRSDSSEAVQGNFKVLFA